MNTEKNDPSPVVIKTVEKNDPFAAVKINEFRNMLAARFFFVMGLRMAVTLVGWWIYNLTNAPFAIGLVGLSEVIPAVILALYAGHVIDISEKRTLLSRGIVLYIFTIMVLFLLSTSYTGKHLSSYAIAVGIYAVMFCNGILRAFTGPVFNVLLGLIVPKQTLKNAATWNQTTFLFAGVCGHATGGFMIAFAGISGAFITTTGLLAISFILVQFLRRRPALNVRGEKRTWDSVREGLVFVYRTKELLGALTLDLFAVFFGGVTAMIPVYARDILRITPQEYGWLNAATDIGAICTVTLLILLPLKRKQGITLMFAAAMFGVCIIIFGLSKVFWLSFAALLVAGIVDGISVVIRGTIMQLKTPDHMRGRVMSVNSMFINSSNEFGQFESGLAARILGVIPSVIFGGCVTIAVVCTTWFKSPKLRKMEY